ALDDLPPMSFGFALTALALCTHAIAHPAARPEFSVGDTWTFVYTEGSRLMRPGTYRTTSVRTVTGLGSDQYETTVVSTPEGGEAKTTSPPFSRDWNDYGR